MRPVFLDGKIPRSTTDFKRNSRLGLLSSREASQHRKIINPRTDLLRQKRVALISQDTHKSTRTLRTQDVKARTYSRIASNSPFIARAKRGTLLNARNDSYQGLHKPREIEKAVTRTTSRSNPTPNVLQVFDTTPVQSGQSRTGLRAPEREESRSFE